jgi:hypothetical protein
MCLDHNFLAVDSMTNFDQNVIYDGVLGLAPSSKDGKPLLIDQLFNAGLIDTRAFAINLGSGFPMVTFGNVESMMIIYNRKIEHDSKEIAWHPIHDKENWSV